jgi:hypothetical protein
MEGVMSSRNKKGESGTKRVELKYCEHCGGLWIREDGGGVYCEKCQPKVDDLPIPRKKRAAKVCLPVGPQTVVGEVRPENRDEDSGDFEAAGGVA